MKLAGIRFPSISQYVHFRRGAQLRLVQPVHIKADSTLAFLPRRVARSIQFPRLAKVPLGGKQFEDIPSFIDREEFATSVDEALGEGIGTLVRLGGVPILRGEDPMVLASAEQQTDPDLRVRLLAQRTELITILDTFFDVKTHSVIYLQNEKMYACIEYQTAPGGHERGHAFIQRPTYGATLYPGVATLLEDFVAGGLIANADTDPHIQAPPDDAELAAEKTVRQRVVPPPEETPPAEPEKPKPAIGPVNLGYAYGVSYIGGRKNHEDNFHVAEILENGTRMLIVADGMGGHSAGEVASAIAIETASTGVMQGESATDIIQHAHKRIELEAAADARKHGMGTTLDIATITGNTLNFGHIGDSRIYMVNADGAVTLLTQDHNIAVLANPEFAAENFPISGDLLLKLEGELQGINPYILSGLGVSTSYTQSGTATLFPGEWVLLCSDGLTDALRDTETDAGDEEKAAAQRRFVELLQQYRREGKTIQEAAELLADTALPLASDNVTIVLYEHRVTLESTVRDSIRETFQNVLLGNAVIAEQALAKIIRLATYSTDPELRDLASAVQMFLAY